MRNYFLLLVLFVFNASQAQKLKKNDKQLFDNLQKHVVFLAADGLEGRRTGTAGEKIAADYISNEFKNIGLTPKGTSSYLQPFIINEGKLINPSTHFFVNETALVLNKDFFPLAFSPNVSIEEMPSMALKEMGMPWFYDIKELLEENKNNPHFDVVEAVKTKAKEVEKKGATALFIYNSSSINDGLAFNEKDRSELLSIPVVYINKGAVQKHFNDVSEMLDIKLKIDIGAKTRTGNNVVGMIDNNAFATVVIGAHFDHLGFGEDGNSMLRNIQEIHNGADDNASGTAALIELARLLKNSKLNQNNYLFIAFSGEELGLFGSKFFTENPTIDLSTVNYMINMDMIGRLNDSSKTITVGGFGTSPSWSAAYNERSKKNKLFNGELKFRFDSSGTGPSDHTSFYRKDIPVLFYFTGLHTDYHKPTDDHDKINYYGQLEIVKHIFSLLEWQNKNGGKLAFAKTREAQTTTTARFSVTMGIMPDYTFSGSGVRADGVTDGRPAAKAGLKTGDIITQLGEHTINSMETYMQALSKFKKGDKAKVFFTRGDEKLSTTVEF